MSQLAAEAGVKLKPHTKIHECVDIAKMQIEAGASGIEVGAIEQAEAMADGGSITVSTERIPGGIEVKIRDEGMGIPENDLQQIFEPFYTTRKGGSGLGLSISFEIVEAHGGEISTISRPGEGATFIIRLPSE